MLTPRQIRDLREQTARITDPIADYLLRDIVRRIAQAGQLTSTAAYQIWVAQHMGVSQREVKKQLRKLLRLSHQEIRRIMYQSTQSGYELDVSRFPTEDTVPFEQNTVLQQIVSAAVELADDEFTNITQTIGFVNPYGKVEPLTQAYRSCTDFAFKQVITGAASYTEAIRQATRNLAGKGVRVINYESGVHTSLEAAVRRNIMGGLGLMQEQVSQVTHDQLGCDGWEITAHANSAPDHEPIQGKQYADAAYQALNNSLCRRIGTLNCGHAAFPIILGVNQPQYTPAELEKFRQDNEKGVTVEGKHYTGYEATQKQRALERAIRRQKNRIMVDETAGDDDRLLTDRIKLNILRQRYAEFSDAAGFQTQEERTEVAGFGEGAKPPALTSEPESPTPPQEIPVVSEVPAPQAETIPSHTEQPTASQSPEVQTDVTERYLQTAAPGQGEVTLEEGYKVKGHQDELKMAHWLRDTFGGDIKLLKESEIKNQKRPDFLWNEKLWELKGASSINGADKSVQHAIKQIQDNPGGIILNVLEDVDLPALERQITSRIKRSKIDALDLIVLLKGDLAKVLRYQK